MDLLIEIAELQKKIKPEEVGETGLQPITHHALAEDPSSVQNAHVGQITTAYNASSTGSDTVF